MTAEEELIHLRQVNSQQQEHIRHLEEQIIQLTEHLKALEERQAKDSHNSSLPPSSDRFSRQPKSLRKKSGKKAGGQPGHPGQTLRFSSTPDAVIVQAVERCEHCQYDLHNVASQKVDRRQVVDIPTPRVFVREYHVEQKVCPQCQQVSCAPFPEGVRAPVQYGPTIGAMAVYLVQQHLLPLARTCEVLEDLVGVKMSEGTLATLIERCAQQLEPVETQIKEALVQAEVIHQDETGLYVHDSRQWVHVTSTPALTHYHVHPSRGHEALDTNGILPRFAGTSVHDGWGAYFRYACQHAACNVHLLRDLTFLSEEQGWIWAARLKVLLLKMKDATDELRERGSNVLDPLEVADWQAQFFRLLAEGEQAHPPIPPPIGRRGRAKQSAARNLLTRLDKQQDAFLAFLHDLRVPFDNNLAERDLRMIKVQQKVSGCFRSAEGAHAFARIRGYLSTLRKQGLPLLAALQATLQGSPLLPSF